MRNHRHLNIFKMSKIEGELASSSFFSTIMVHNLASLFKELQELFGEYNPKRALDLKTLVRSYPYTMHKFRDSKPKN